MTNFDLYRLLNFIVNKDVYANAISPPEFELALSAKSTQLFTSKLPSERAINNQQVVGITRQNQHDLAPFALIDTVSISGGKADIAPWYYVEDFYTATSKTSELISFGELSARLKSYIKPPTATDIVGCISSDGLIIYGATGNVTIAGYRLPDAPVFVVTTNESTLEMEYDTDASTELEWNDGCKIDIIYMMLQDMGVSIERQDVVQLANKVTQLGK